MSTMWSSKPGNRRVRNRVAFRGGVRYTGRVSDPYPMRPIGGAEPVAAAGRVKELRPGAVTARTIAFRGEREPFHPSGAAFPAF